MRNYVDFYAANTFFSLVINGVVASQGNFVTAAGEYDALQDRIDVIKQGYLVFDDRYVFDTEQLGIRYVKLDAFNVSRLIAAILEPGSDDGVLIAQAILDGQSDPSIIVDESPRDLA
jgi:hypothetical protein